MPGVDANGNPVTPLGKVYTLIDGDSNYVAGPASQVLWAGNGYWMYFPVQTTVSLPADLPPAGATFELPHNQYLTLATRSKRPRRFPVPARFTRTIRRPPVIKRRRCCNLGRELLSTSRPVHLCRLSRVRHEPTCRLSLMGAVLGRTEQAALLAMVDSVAAPSASPSRKWRTARSERSGLRAIDTCREVGSVGLIVLCMQVLPRPETCDLPAARRGSKV
jgi:hypothetical protein